jgi:hypothetical protein
MFSSLLTSCDNSIRCAKCCKSVNTYDDLWGGLCKKCDKQAKCRSAEINAKLDNFKSIIKLLEDSKKKDILLAWLLSKSMSKPWETTAEELNDLIEHTENLLAKTV